MKRFAFLTVLTLALASAAWVVAGDACGASAKTCGADAQMCAGGGKTACAEKQGCADKVACGGGACAKEASGACSGTVAEAAPGSECQGCGQVAALAQNDGDVRVDVVRLDNGVSLVFVTGKADRVADLQKAILAVNGNVSRAAASATAPAGLCSHCVELVGLARAGARARVEKISSGAIVVLTGSEESTVRSLQAWADGLRQAATAMVNAVPQAG